MSTPTAIDPIDMGQPLKVYWAPGCSSCLRTKEFLRKNRVAFVSINALEDKEGFEQLARIGVRRVPIVARGKHWADGQVLKDVARVAGISLDPARALPPAELMERGARILDVAMQLIANVPEGELDVLLPGRPRSYKQLGCHVFQILELFVDLVEHRRRVEFDDFFQPVPSAVVSRATLLVYCDAIRARYAQWAGSGMQLDWNTRADVYYGEQTLHEFLERSVWHAAQHTRQIEAVLRKLDVAVEAGFTPADLAGLPLPDEVYDDQVRL